MGVVKRYEESCMEGGGVAIDPNGDYVEYKDYFALKQKCNWLEKFVEQAFQAHPNLDLDIEASNEST